VRPVWAHLSRPQAVEKTEAAQDGCEQSVRSAPADTCKHRRVPNRGYEGGPRKDDFESGLLFHLFLSHPSAPPVLRAVVTLILMAEEGAWR